MMKSSEKIAKEVEKTLALVEKLEKVEPRPFFYTRLMSRISNVREKAINQQIVKKIQYAVICLLLLLSINGYTIYKLWPLRTEDQQSQAIETFIENYHLEVMNIYTLTENDLN